MNISGDDQRKKIYTVSELTGLVRVALEDEFSSVWVQGEISNYTRHSSGHTYFSIRDEGAVLSCVLFRRTGQRIKFKVENGQQVICGGRISVYDKRGQYQLYVETLEPKGLGALQVAFEQLKKKLFEEGLFDQAKKKPIPYLPARIGVVTSKTGAAIRDIVNVATRRFQNVEVILYPVTVQGDTAKNEIARAVADFNEYHKGSSRDKKIDVLIVGRGGGSLEDLWAFNEEVVARAIYASEIPVISAVGHEIDWTISDFVADKRAPTPSAAAELAIPLKEDLLRRVDEASARLDSLIREKIVTLHGEVKRLSESYILKQPVNLILQYQQRVDELARNAEVYTVHSIDIKEAAFRTQSGKLEMLSPFKVLSRGYSITLDAETGRVIKRAGEVKKGTRMRSRLEDGEIISTVDSAGHRSKG